MDTSNLRDKSGRILPGKTANPNGRPKKEHCFTDIARQLLGSKKINIEYTFTQVNGTEKTAKFCMESDRPIYHGLVCALIKEGMGGNVQAIKELIDRTEGKARESIDHTTNGKDIAALSSDQVFDRICSIASKIRKQGDE